MANPKNFFNLHELSQGLSRELAPGVVTRIFPGDQAMLSVVRLAPNAEGEIHHHAEEQWGILLEGGAVRIQGGVSVPVQAGDFWRTPGGLPHGIRAGAAGALVVDIFSPPRKTYTQDGSGFGLP